MDTSAQPDSASPLPKKRGPIQFGLKHLLALPVAVAIVLALFALLLQDMPSATPAARRAQCSNNLKQIGLALHTYHAKYGCFPPAYIADSSGRPMHSWRVLILPFMEQDALYRKYRFDEPWNGPNNRKLADIIPEWFQCPSDDTREPAMTNYLAVIGPETAWPGDKSRKLTDFADGTSDTILVVEVKNSGIHWMEPRDLHVLQMAPGVNLKAGQGPSSAHAGGANAGIADGSVRFLPETISPGTLRALLTVAGHELPAPDDPTLDEMHRGKGNR